MQVAMIALAITGCVQQSELRPVTDPTTRYYGQGYSALPPQGKDWELVRYDPSTVAFGKRLPGKVEWYVSFVTYVTSRWPPAKEAGSAADYPQIIEHLLIHTPTEERFRIVSAKAAPFGAKGDFCAQYDMVQEERDNPNVPGVLLEMTTHGFMCLDATAQFMIHAFYSERKAQGGKSVFDDKLKLEAEEFLSNVKYTPYRSHTRSVQ